MLSLSVLRLPLTSIYQTRSIRIDPSFNKQGEPDWPEIQDRRKFWDSPDTVQWFEDRGYTLYRRVLDDDGNRSSITVPARPSQKYQDADYPYAYHDGNPSREGLPPLGENEFYVRLLSSTVDDAILILFR